MQGGDLILPDIQHDFVWGTDRIYKLLDSILRSYPFGTLLFWNTKLRVQYREFIKDWADDRAYTFRIKEAGQPSTLVLDGQQRLQSLYIAVFGSYEQQMLYFDLLSGGHQQDVAEVRFVCEFMSRPLRRTQSQQWRPSLLGAIAGHCHDPRLEPARRQDTGLPSEGRHRGCIVGGNPPELEPPGTVPHLQDGRGSERLDPGQRLRGRQAADTSGRDPRDLRQGHSGGQVFSKSDLMFSSTSIGRTPRLKSPT